MVSNKLRKEKNKFPPLNSEEADVSSISPLSLESLSKDDGKGNNATRKKNGVRIRSNQVQVYLLIYYYYYYYYYFIITKESP